MGRGIYEAEHITMTKTERVNANANVNINETAMMDMSANADDRKEFGDVRHEFIQTMQILRGMVDLTDDYTKNLHDYDGLDVCCIRDMVEMLGLMQSRRDITERVVSDVTRMVVIGMRKLEGEMETPCSRN